MKRDNLIAVFSGFLFGAFFALFIINLPNFINIIKQKKSDESVKISPTSQITPEQKKTLQIFKPDPDYITSSSSAQIQGKSQKDDFIIIETEKDIIPLTTDESGNFQTLIEIIEGRNTINVTSYTKDKDSQSQTLDIFYTTEKL